MLEVLKPLLEEMLPHLVRAGIREPMLALEAEDLPSVYDQVVNIKKREYQRLIEIWLLVPEGHWQFYEDRGATELRQCRMLRAAQKEVRHAWKTRVVIFLRKREPLLKPSPPDVSGGFVQ